MSIRLSYNDTTDLAEVISTMEDAGLPNGHSGKLLLYDVYGTHYATIEVKPNGTAELVVSEMQDIQDG